MMTKTKEKKKDFFVENTYTNRIKTINEFTKDPISVVESEKKRGKQHNRTTRLQQNEKKKKAENKIQID